MGRERLQRVGRRRRAQLAQQNGLSTVEAIFNMYQRPNHLGADLTALLDGMLRIEPAERMTLDAVCRSAWLSDVGAALFAHDGVVPLAPDLWRLRAQPRRSPELAVRVGNELAGEREQAMDRAVSSSGRTRLPPPIAAWRMA